MNEVQAMVQAGHNFGRRVGGELDDFFFESEERIKTIGTYMGQLVDLHDWQGETVKAVFKFVDADWHEAIAESRASRAAADILLQR